MCFFGAASLLPHESSSLELDDDESSLVSQPESSSSSSSESESELVDESPLQLSSLELESDSVVDSVEPPHPSSLLDVDSPSSTVVVVLPPQVSELANVTLPLDSSTTGVSAGGVPRGGEDGGTSV